MPFRLRGLIAAPYTPFTGDFGIHWAAIPRYAQFLQENQLTAAFIGGTTGEGHSLAFDERIQLTEQWIQAGATGLPIIVHVGSAVLSEATKLAAHAERGGAAAIACMAPGYFKPEPLQALVDWCQAVAAAAPRTPFYYYHMPSMNGVNYPMAEFVPRATAAIPTFAGLKYSYEDLADFAACVRWSAGRVDIVMGRDELLLAGLDAGATAAVGSTYNYAAPLYRSLIDARARGDRPEAERQQRTAEAMIRACSGLGVSHLAASKTLMGRFGVECGPARPPLCNPSPAQIAPLSGLLNQINFRAFCCRPLSGFSPAPPF